MRPPSFSLLITSSPTTTTSTTTMPSSLSSSSALSKSKKLSTSSSTPTSSNNHQHQRHHLNNHHNHNHPSSSSPLLCRQSPFATATLDLLIFILVLFSGAFLLTSYFAYIFNSLSLLLPPLFLSHSSIIHNSPILYILGFVLLFTVAVGFELCCGFRSRKCDNPKCKGLKKAMEFDLQLQTEECLKSGPNEIDRLPWKGGTETNPDYECIRTELRKMAPPNGRAVLLFRAKCGCPVAKLVGWGRKRGRRHKKALANVALNGGDHR